MSGYDMNGRAVNRSRTSPARAAHRLAPDPVEDHAEEAGGLLGLDARVRADGAHQLHDVGPVDVGADDAGILRPIDHEVEG